MSANVIIAPRMQPLVVNFGPFVKTMNDEDFTELCRLNRDLRIERTRGGDLIILPPTGGETGRRGFNLTVLFGEWVERDGTSPRRGLPRRRISSVGREPGTGTRQGPQNFRDIVPTTVPLQFCDPSPQKTSSFSASQ